MRFEKERARGLIRLSSSPVDLQASYNALAQYWPPVLSHSTVVADQAMDRIGIPQAFAVFRSRGLSSYWLGRLKKGWTNRVFVNEGCCRHCRHSLSSHLERTSSSSSVKKSRHFRSGELHSTLAVGPISLAGIQCKRRLRDFLDRLDLISKKPNTTTCFRISCISLFTKPRRYVYSDLT